jgi:hypothetical protein
MRGYFFAAASGARKRSGTTIHSELNDLPTRGAIEKTNFAAQMRSGVADI